MEQACKRVQQAAGKCLLGWGDMEEWLERYRAYVIAALTIVVAMGFVVFLVSRPRTVPVVIATPPPVVTPTTVPTPTPAPLRVYVTGAVRAPDVYRLPPGSIVKDAIAAAGGAADDADLERINLALELRDQQQLYVPRKGEAAPPVPPPSAPSTAGADMVNINTASVEELDALPGIGPAIAQRIVDYRAENGPFATIEDIMKVNGIGPATFARLKGRITTR